MSIVTNVSRRDFLKAGAGLTLAVSIPSVFASNKLKAGGPGQAGSFSQLAKGGLAIAFRMRHNTVAH